eukprot:scaffold34608_cov172-Amphora_coffeaeformis.AAC.2
MSNKLAKVCPRLSIVNPTRIGTGIGIIICLSWRRWGCGCGHQPSAISSNVQHPIRYPALSIISNTPIQDRVTPMRIDLLILATFSMLIYRTLAFQTHSARSFVSRTTAPSATQTVACFSSKNKSTRFPVRHLSMTPEDENYLQEAIECARNGLGVTFPNPAVGCVLVRNSDGKVLGKGFHPRAGYPHAEVFALFEAAGLVTDGVSAAKEIVQKREGSEEEGVVEDLLHKYSSADGADKLFGDLFADTPVTAYVTLEPCCHFGRTPPCAYSLATSKVSRVVVGFRDPNPRVDGGGVKLLQDVGVTVDMASEGAPSKNKACEGLVTDFVKRITPSPLHDDYSYVTGAMRRALRAFANKGKTEGALTEIQWGGSKVHADEDMEEALEKIILPARWMENLDTTLWKKEVVLLRLNAAVAKKKGAKILGQRIADALRAHVAQTVGHTVLLYRPGMPPVIDLAELATKAKDKDAE